MKKSHLLGTLSICLITAAANAAVLPLESRLGGLAYYDPNLNITWAADTNINEYGTWYEQTAWVSGLMIGGVSEWRLPNADVNGDRNVVDCSFGGVTGCEDNEMGYLFWEEGIKADTPNPLSADFQGYYWSSTNGVGTDLAAWAFDFILGQQVSEDKSYLYYALAVHDGDVVPVPASAWLFGSGLLGLIGISRRRKAA